MKTGKIKLLAIILFAGIVMLSCNQGGECADRTVFFNGNFVESYHILDTIRCVGNGNGGFVVDAAAKGIISKGHYATSNNDDYIPDVPYLSDSIYNYYTQVYGDTTFFANVIYNLCAGGFSGHSFYANQLVAINVISNADFDNMHLAGSSLNDILWLSSLSPMPFIESKCIEKYDWNNPNVSTYFNNTFSWYFVNNKDWLEYFHPVDKKLLEITSNDLRLLTTDPHLNTSLGALTMRLMNISFISEPALSKTHTFTLTMTDNEGKTYSATFTKSWE